MQQALQITVLGAEQIDYINAHGQLFAARSALPDQRAALDSAIRPAHERHAQLARLLGLPRLADFFGNAVASAQALDLSQGQAGEGSIASANPALDTTHARNKLTRMAADENNPAENHKLIPDSIASARSAATD